MSPTRRSSLTLPTVLVLLFATMPFLAGRLTESLGIGTSPDTSRTLGYLTGVGLWLSVALLLDRLLAALVWNRLASRRDEVGAPHLLIDLVRLSIYSLAVTIIVGYVFGLSLTGFWATSGVVGLVLGFAVRNLILDLFTGIAVNVEQPYREGDWLEAQIPGAPKVAA